MYRNGPRFKYRSRVHEGNPSLHSHAFRPIRKVAEAISYAKAIRDPLESRAGLFVAYPMHWAMAISWLVTSAKEALSAPRGLSSSEQKVANRQRLFADKAAQQHLDTLEGRPEPHAMVDILGSGYNRRLGSDPCGCADRSFRCSVVLHHGHHKQRIGLGGGLAYQWYVG